MTVYLPDVNVLLALVLEAHPHQKRAQAWFEALAAHEEVVLCRASQESLLRLLTTPAVFAPVGASPLSNDEAWAVSDALLTDPLVRLMATEPTGFERVWREFSGTAQASPKRWMDAYLAAFARSLGAVLVTLDSAFSSYPRLDAIVLTPSA